MKFLVDAQLPVRLARFLREHDYDTIHTKDLPQKLLIILIIIIISK